MVTALLKGSSGNGSRRVCAIWIKYLFFLDTFCAVSYRWSPSVIAPNDVEVILSAICTDDFPSLTFCGELAIRWHEHPDFSPKLPTLSQSRFLIREISPRCYRFRSSKKAPPYDECLSYRRAGDGRIMILTTYDDNILMTGGYTEEIGIVFMELQAKYGQDLGTSNKFVGVSLTVTEYHYC